ncbi:hypothetical protein F5Y16DRAFT_363484 [Xylariaceae sp. FL0255]|nr:hypothetical protein F5Y16DRAFT_363484 [Xylariaceae sp. FL0255]
MLGLFLKGVMMLYNDLYGFTYSNEWHTKQSYDLFKRLRSNLHLPNFESIALNRAWPLFQGLPSGNRHMCDNCPKHDKIGECRDSANKGKWLCKTCYKYQWQNGVPQTFDEEGNRIKFTNWRNVQRQCANCEIKWQKASQNQVQDS